jgi:arginine decarboxylase
MDAVGPRKAVNRAKSALRKREGPAESDQGAAPLADAMAAYWESDVLTFSIPAHNGGRGPAPEFTRWAGIDAARADLPTSHGLDTRNRAWQVQATAQELFADAVGAKQTLFSTNGSTLSVHVAILTVAGPGETLVLGRNGHKSTFSGLILAGARPIYVEPFYDEELEIAHDVLPGQLAAALDANPGAAAAMVSTPSYYGTAGDVQALADACHERDKPLVTDDAWGLDYAVAGHPDLPASALDQGSDLTIGSVHKTLPALMQTSVLSVGSERIDSERLKLCFELAESTSASGLLLSSIDGARRQFVREGEALLDRALSSAGLLRERLATEVPELRVITEEELSTRPGVAAVDPTHLLIETYPIGLTGYEANDWIREERNIDVEFADHRRIMALVTFAHGEAEVDRFVRALRDLVDAHPDVRDGEPRTLPTRAEIRAEQAMPPRDAFFAKTENVRPSQAVGRISAEFVTPYPPGIPAVAAGEVYNDANVAYLEELAGIGAFFEGAADPSLSKLRVVAE